MFKIPKKIKERIITGINRYQKIVRTAKAKDVNEADTVSVIKGILEEAFGWDRFTEITSEYAIRGTYCDLAIKVEDSIKYLIEVKAAGIELKESHMRQTIQYGASLGMPWVVLTNGSQWRIYKIKFEKPLTHDLVVEFDFVGLNPNDDECLDILNLLTKEGVEKELREEYYKRIQTLNRFTVGHLLLSTPVIKAVRRELRGLFEGLKVEEEQLTKIVKDEVLKRDLFEGEKAEETKSIIQKNYRKIERAAKAKKAVKTSAKIETSPPPSNPIPDEAAAASGNQESAD